MNDFDWITDSEKLYNINDHFNKISQQIVIEKRRYVF